MVNMKKKQILVNGKKTSPPHYQAGKMYYKKKLSVNHMNFNRAGFTHLQAASCTCGAMDAP